jgi:hypothetical protein
MRKSVLGLAVVASLCSAPILAAPQDQTPSQSAPQTEAQRIAALEARVQSLEAQLQQVLAAQQSVTPAAALLADAAPVDDFEALAATPEASDAGSGVDAVAAPQAGSGGGASAGPNAFNPAVAIILNGSLSRHSLAGADEGFSLGESEVSFAANIDDKFFGQLTLAIEDENGEDHLGVEEAFVDTTALPGGLAVRVGRFFSNIGYLNSHHAHTDSFFDRPLAYQAFLGEQYGDDGVQVRWVAPTSTFLELGGEVFRGQTFPSGGAQDGGLGTRTLFAHTGGSVGSESEWLAGVSMLKAKTAGGEDGFNGDATVYVADGTWKWAPQGNFKDGGITVRGEYLLDDRDGMYVDPDDTSIAMPWVGKRRGAYLETVYRLNRTWDVGYRYDRLWAGDDDPFAGTFDPDRHSAELTWRNSEFSLVRLQVSRERADAGATDNAITLQYQTSLGAHGAHKF